MTSRRGRGVAAGLLAAGTLLAACSSGAGGSATPGTSTASSTMATAPSSGTAPTAQELAPAADLAQSKPVDGISCSSSEQTLFHIHAHLAVYVGGRQRLLAPGIGIGAPLQFEQTTEGPFVSGGSCFSWLHTHDATGVIHIESPVQRIYTLGNFFDIWGQPLSPTQVGPAQGTVTAFVDGTPFTGDPRSIPLNAHAVIQLDVGSPDPAPQPYTFPAGL